jgi:hypothetical protein
MDIDSHQAIRVYLRIAVDTRVAIRHWECEGSQLARIDSFFVGGA